MILAKEWQPIAVALLSRYHVSSSGDIRNSKNGYVLKQHPNPDGYPTVGLTPSKIRVTKTYLVHTLVAKTFLQQVDGKPFVDHINKIRDDNRVENLRWASALEQVRNRGLVKQPRRTQQQDILGEIWGNVSVVVGETDIMLGASDKGRIRLPSGYVTTGNGKPAKVYKSVCIANQGKQKKMYCHVLVAQAFLGPKVGKDCVVNHIDHDRHNNTLDNLEYCSYKENAVNSFLSAGSKRKYTAVTQLALDGTPVKRYLSLAEAERQTGVQSANIVSACKGRLKTAGGFKWML